MPLFFQRVPKGRLPDTAPCLISTCADRTTKKPGGLCHPVAVSYRTIDD